MFTKLIRKIAAKIAMATILFSAISPLANPAYALSGTLTVGFNHIDGGFEVRNVFETVIAQKDSNDCPELGNGYFTCQLSLPTGFYTVKFDGGVQGFQTPSDVDVQLDELGDEVLGTYIPEGGIQNGVLGVAVNHINGGFLVLDVFDKQILDTNATNCGAPQDNWYVCQMSLPTGAYTIKFKTVNGFDAPNDIDVQLSKIGATVYGSYVVQGPSSGTLTVGINHMNGGYTVYNVFDDPIITKSATDCGPSKPNGYFVCQHSLPTGFYTVKFLTVDGYNTPEQVDVQLGAQGETVWGTYTLIQAGNGQLTVAMNHEDGSYTIYNVFNDVVGNGIAQNCGPVQGGWYKCQQSLPTGFYTVKFGTVDGFIKPSQADVQLSALGATVWGYYAVQPSGVIEVKIVDQDNQTITNLPAGEWQLKECVNADPASCTDVMASGGVGGVYNNLEFATYRIVFPNPVLPAGYTARIVLPSIYQVLDAQNTSLIFTIQYTEEVVNPENAFVNVQTTPVKAAVRMVVTSPAQPNQNEVTTHQVNPTPIYDLAQADWFTLPTSGGVTASTDYTITCLPAPGGYHAPVNPIVVNDAVYTAGSENLAGLCIYTAVPNNEKVTITIDTIGIDAAAIYVDGVEVRATSSSAEVPVIITTTEAHTISFEDKDPTHFTKPVNIAIPANSLNSGMTPAQLKYLGYYVALGNLATAEVNTENQNGWVYLTIGADPTKWNVGYATTDTNNPLIVHFDETVNHEFHFQDRNAPASPVYFLRAVPVTDAGFSVSQTITQVGSNVTYFQERYTYAAPHALGTVHLIGDYISSANAAFFRARTTNADPVHGNINLNISGDAETLHPGSQIWTRVFISDVVNDSDTTSFQSPITVNAINYTANPLSFDLSTYNPGPVVNDLQSTYVEGVPSNLKVRLISLDPNIQPTVGLIVTLDTTITQPTVNNGGSIEANFSTVNAGLDHLVECPVIAGLTTPNDINIPAGTLVPGDNTVQCIYADADTDAYVLVQTEADDNVNFEAPIILSVDGVDYNVGSTVNDGNPTTPATLCVLVDTARNNVIEYGAMAGYLTPAPDTVNVVAGTDCANPANVVNGLYVHPGNTEIVTIIAYDETGVNILTTADITVNSVVVSTNGQYSASYPVGTSLNIQFEDVATHGVPTIEVNGVSVGIIHTTTYIVLDNPSANTVEAFYPLNGGNNVLFNVTTRDNLNNPLTQNITHGATGTETTVATPASFQVAQPVTAYTINFSNRAGYVTPGSVVVAGNAIATIPANVTITDNGAAYVVGTQLAANHTYAIVGTYVPYFTIDKVVLQEQSVANNNKRVDYQITVTRSASSPNGAMSITLHDTIADAGRKLNGSSGGVMNVVPQGNVYSVCSNGCGDITAGSVIVDTSNPGATVTITYQLLSNNTGVPAGQSSNFTNTLTGTFTHNATQVNLTDSAVVTVAATPTSGTPGNTGGGGGGGGTIMIKGDMILEVTKLVSLDNKNWVDASEEEDALVIPSNVDSTLYTKVKVKNLGQVTATNIKYSEGFDEGDSKITTEDIENVQGNGISLNDTTNTITINQLKVGEETNFTYQQKLHEDGSKGELAEEYLVLDGFSTKLTKNQDGLTKHGVGDHYPSWLVAGSGTGVITDKDLLEMFIKTDKASAKVGEEVVYTITAKNNADYDFTGTTVTWDYDSNALQILNAGAGRNTGTEIHWNRGNLKAGETATYIVTVRVKGTAPVGGRVRTTARGLVNEIENPSVAEHYLNILAGAQPVELAQTGAAPTFGLLLASILAYLAYMNTGRRRYLALKKEALRPL